MVTLLSVLLILVVVLGVRALASPAEPPGDPSSPTTPSPAPVPSDGGGASDGGGSDGGGASDGSPVAAAATGGVTAEITAASTEIPRSGMTGEGTWTVAEPATDGAASEGSASDGNVRSYLLRVEDGIDLEAGEVAGVVAEVLADERGWEPLEHVAFRQVTEPAEADFTISLASPPTVDELCAPARTNGLWSCRIGEEVVLNADRWTLMTPVFDDLGEYRAYMVNHEVGHFLGHGHETCGGEGEAAPVMLQQSMDLGGCRANPWPSADGEA
ncbi:DUF3152 domain-containing protein [Brachybacterium sp. SGAir0954]|uniref:DUF3152 domain-containing protein n=1 Tax=Brachybacterium sp. SGAir0954 TaxID=2571029 RepID=UPI0010F92382|nr:DUF3152 domain-containing protein [Brachybacterium sp. SGAir0954]